MAKVIAKSLASTRELDDICAEIDLFNSEGRELDVASVLSGCEIRDDDPCRKVYVSFVRKYGELSRQYIAKRQAVAERRSGAKTVRNQKMDLERVAVNTLAGGVIGGLIDPYVGVASAAAGLGFTVYDEIKHTELDIDTVGVCALVGGFIGSLVDGSLEIGQYIGFVLGGGLAFMNSWRARRADKRDAKNSPESIIKGLDVQYARDKAALVQATYAKALTALDRYIATHDKEPYQSKPF